MIKGSGMGLENASMKKMKKRKTKIIMGYNGEKTGKFEWLWSMENQSFYQSTL